MKTLLAFFTLSSLLIATQPHAQPTATAPARSPANVAPAPPATKMNAVSAPKTSQILAQQRTGIVCTIFAGNFHWATLTLRITQYSTMGLVENCDEEHFNQLTVTSIEAQLRAVQRPMFVIPGAAHHMLMDVNLASLPKPFIRIGELMMTPVGEIHVRLHELIANPGLRKGSVVGSEYTPFGLRSNIQYIWNIGKPVHRLISPNGDRYVMFGYTDRVIRTADRRNLAEIGPLLNLPVGWKYETYLLDRTLTIKTDPTNDFTLNIMFDDASNMYIQADD